MHCSGVQGQISKHLTSFHYLWTWLNVPPFYLLKLNWKLNIPTLPSNWHSWCQTGKIACYPDKYHCRVLQVKVWMMLLDFEQLAPTLTQLLWKGNRSLSNVNLHIKQKHRLTFEVLDIAKRLYWYVFLKFHWKIFQKQEFILDLRRNGLKKIQGPLSCFF